MQAESSWQPLLRDGEAAEALDLVAQIARAVEQGNWYVDDCSLASGRSGLAVFHGYLAEARRSTEDAERAAAHLDAAMDRLAETQMTVGLYRGFTGVSWTVDHLLDRLEQYQAHEESSGEPDLTVDTADADSASKPAGADCDEDDILVEIDRALDGMLCESPWPLEYDLISGLVGVGIYTLARLPRPSARVCLERVIGHLDGLAEHQSAGITWFTPPHLVPPLERERSAGGYYNLGVAHGVPGIIAFLAQAHAAGVADATVDSLLSGALDWLLAQERPAAGTARFGYDVTPGQPPSRATRPAWCYGDLGIAAAFACSARLVDDPRLEREATDLARAVARLDPATWKIPDAGLCHGAAGVGHLFNRIHQSTGDESARDAALFWIRCACDLHQPGRGYGGFPARNGDDWAETPGLLEGAVGVGLALLAASTAVEPAWDQMLLASSALDDAVVDRVRSR